MLHKVFGRMLRMCPAAWEYLIRSLQFSCLLLFCALLLLSHSREESALRLQAAAFQESSQVCLLLAVLIPPCLEDRLGTGAGSPPGSSDR